MKPALTMMLWWRGAEGTLTWAPLTKCTQPFPRRALHSSQFHVSDSIHIFDNIISSLPSPPPRDTLTNLAYKPLPLVISNLGLALVLEVRDTVMSSDENGLLEALMRYQYPTGGNGRVEGGQYKRVGRQGIDGLFERAEAIGKGNIGGTSTLRIAKVVMTDCAFTAEPSCISYSKEATLETTWMFT